MLYPKVKFTDIKRSSALRAQSLEHAINRSLLPFFNLPRNQNSSKNTFKTVQERIKAILQKDHPKHIALIMDGNRRWAKQRGMSSRQGHLEGAKRLIELLSEFPKIGVQTVSLYAFSTENWKREGTEVRALFHIFELYLKTYAKKMVANGVKLKVIGDRSPLSPALNKLIDRVEEQTSRGTTLNCLLAINYGGRNELIRAVKSWYDAEVVTGRSSVAELDESKLPLYLDTQGYADPDLVIRTSGQKRVSNFLLWQMAYAEIISAKALWPDFSVEDLLDCVEKFQENQRRYGK